MRFKDSKQGLNYRKKNVKLLWKNIILGVNRYGKDFLEFYDKNCEKNYVFATIL